MGMSEDMIRYRILNATTAQLNVLDEWAKNPDMVLVAVPKEAKFVRYDCLACDGYGYGDGVVVDGFYPDAPPCEECDGKGKTYVNPLPKISPEQSTGEEPQP